MVSTQVTEMMKYLADNYVEGIAVISGVIILIYLIFSIRLLFTSRDADMNLYASAFIPGLNIVLWLIKCIKVSHNRWIESHILSDEDEIEL